MASNSTTLTIRILADASQAAKTMQGAGSDAGKLATGMKRSALPAAAVVAGLGAMGKSAAEDAHGQAMLAQSLKQSAGATDQQVSALEEWISKTALATGVADDQLRPALSTIARSTGDVSTAQGAMGAVLDTAAATGKDTQTVAAALAKAYGGNTAALGKLVPGMDKAVLKSGDMNAIMDELAKKTGGAAAAAAETATGKWQRSTVAFDEAKESIGAGLLPVMQTLSGYLATFGEWAAKNAGLVSTLAIGIGILAGVVLLTNAAMTAYNAATVISGILTKLFSTEANAAGKQGLIVRAATLAWAGAQWVLNAALSANPLTLIVLAVIALIAVFIIAYKKSETFRKIVQAAFAGIKAAAVAVARGAAAAWDALKTALLAVWDFIKNYVLAPLVEYFKFVYRTAKRAVELVLKAWSGLKEGMKAVYEWLKQNVIDPLVKVFDRVVDAVQKVLDWIGKIKIPGPLKKLIGMGKAVFSSTQSGTTIAPAPTVRGRRAGTRAGATGTLTAPGALDALGSPSVIVQVSDRKMAELIDVSIRANATAAARTLTRKQVVTV